MSPSPQSQTFAARAGRWSAQHRRKAIFGWIAFVIASVAIGSAVGIQKPVDDQGNTGEARRADRIVADHFPKYATESVLIQARSGQDQRSPEMRAAATGVIAAVRDLDGVQNVKSPYGRDNGGQVSKDGRSVLVQFEVRGGETLQDKRIDPIEKAVEGVAARNSSVKIGEFGGASANKAISKAFEDDFAKAEKLSLPITIAILILAFGALAAAGIPVLLALSAVFATLGLISIPSQVIPLDDTISSVVLLVGMAVGVDYTLFYLRREREERRRGASPEEALEIAAATSGRAILISGFTVMAAMAGMFMAGDRGWSGLGIAAITVVAVAMIGSVTVVPAVLAWLGDRVNKGRIPFLHRLRRDDGESRAWGWVIDKVLARPVVSIVLAGGLLVALAIPALGMHTANTGTDGLPRSIPIMKVYDQMQAAFPGNQIPASVVIRNNDVTSIQTTAAIRDLRYDAQRAGLTREPVGLSVSPAHHVAIVDLPIVGKGADSRSVDALTKLRSDVIPATVGKLPDTQVNVTGLTAGSKDFNDLVKKRAPIVFAFVLALAFMLLLVTFRSIVIPIKAIVLNLLSVGAAYGVLVEVFQKGHGEKLLGFKSTGAVTSWLPLFLFVILFGLSMDYHVFILSRVREAFDRGMRTEDAVSYGIKQTAGVVTSAAAVMVAVFAIFATLSSIDFKMMGVGLATAILIDATIVRAVLLPASMKLLGKWNWYLPKRLEWLPHISHEPATPVPEPAAA
jgi:RND superfamily putative drug exporter